MPVPPMPPGTVLPPGTVVLPGGPDLPPLPSPVDLSQLGAPGLGDLSPQEARRRLASGGRLLFVSPVSDLIPSLMRSYPSVDRLSPSHCD
jgi:hypothetical protein